jgi:hypothetical protein
MLEVHSHRSRLKIVCLRLVLYMTCDGRREYTHVPGDDLLNVRKDQCGSGNDCMATDFCGLLKQNAPSESPLRSLGYLGTRQSPSAIFAE